MKTINYLKKAVLTSIILTLGVFTFGQSVWVPSNAGDFWINAEKPTKTAGDDLKICTEADDGRSRQAIMLFDLKDITTIDAVALNLYLAKLQNRVGSWQSVGFDKPMTVSMYYKNDDIIEIGKKNTWNQINPSENYVFIDSFDVNTENIGLYTTVNSAALTNVVKNYIGDSLNIILVANDTTPSGNDAAARVLTFKGGEDGDLKKPWLIINDLTDPVVDSVKPANNSVDIKANSVITIDFKEEMYRPSVEAAISFSPALPDTVFTWDTTSLTISSSVPLSDETQYTITIGTEAKDRAGNSLASPYEFSFTTEKDQIPPTVLSVVPVDASVDVKSDSDILIEFSESTMNKDSVNGHAISIVPEVSGLKYSWADGQLTIGHDPFAYGQKYTVTITAIHATDLAGNHLAKDSIFSFTVEDDTYPPAITGKAFPNGTLLSSVPVYAPLTITFDEQVVADSVKKAMLFFPSFTAYDTEWNADTTTLTIYPNTFAELTEYKLMFSDAVGLDKAGNPLAEKDSLVFTTGKTGLFPNQIIYSGWNRDDADKLDAGYWGEMKTLLKEAGNDKNSEYRPAEQRSGVFMFDLKDFSTLDTAIVNLAVSSFKERTFSGDFPKIELGTGKSITMGLYVVDYSYTVKDSLAWSKLNKSMGQLVDSFEVSDENIGKFTQIKSASLTNSFKQYAGDTIAFIVMPIDSSAADLPVVVQFYGVNSKVAKPFVLTGPDNDAPTVISSTPENNNQYVNPSTQKIALTFSEGMYKLSVEKALSISPSIDSMKFEWSGDTTLTIASTKALTAGQAYTLTFSDYAKDHAGNTLTSYTLNFKVSADAEAPSVTEVTPKEAATDVALSDDIVITFSEEMDKTTVESAVTITPDIANKTFTWNNNALTISGDDMTLNTEYQVAIAATATDMSGNALEAFSFSFTTKATSGTNNAFANKVIVYPNPASEYIAIQGTSPANVEIYSNNGVLVLSVQNILEVDISSLTSGNYIVKVEINNENIINSLVVE